MSEQKQGAAAGYLSQIAEVAPEIITVTLPSGAKMTRIKPTVFAAIFDAGDLPTAAADEAAAAWQADGVGVLPDDEQVEPTVDEQEKANIAAGKKALEIRNRVLSGSVSPKLVDHKPKDDNELHWANLLPDDLAYLYKFEAARGEASVMLAMFPDGREQRPLASLSRKKQRTKGKRAGAN